MKFFKVFLFLGVLFCSFESFAAKEEVVVPQEYKVWLKDLKKEMISRGISKKTIKKAFKRDYYNPASEAVSKDQKQPEFVMTSTDYLNRVISKNKVETARQKYKDLYPLFKDMEKKYNVPVNYLIAFWAMESNFGSNFGNHEIIESLTQLSHNPRRSAFFREELYQALKIMDTYDIAPEDMKGSWAGAMGHFQFMPSTFNNYAVDYDGDGYIDIWHKFEDAIASAANYLTQIGWKKNEPWGMEISTTYRFDYANSGINNVKPIGEWTKLGVRDVDGKQIKLNEQVYGSVIFPEGRKGKAYLVLNNFRKIMIWNRSENYALAVSKMADYIVSKKEWKEEEKNQAVVLKTDDVLQIQKFINRLGFVSLDEDGMFGSKTRQAIQQLQKKAMMPQDGYPNYQLLNKINKYNPEIGFAVPLQPKKSNK
ncbi:MAG: lytic murein transglycosylase [Alphaproteobacteria bacterium]